MGTPVGDFRFDDFLEDVPKRYWDDFLTLKEGHETAEALAAAIRAAGVQCEVENDDMAFFVIVLDEGETCFQIEAGVIIETKSKRFFSSTTEAAAYLQPAAAAQLFLTWYQ